MKKTVVVCDVCTAQKRETNHWFAGFSEPLGFAVMTLEASSDENPDAHLCGEKCVTTWVSQQLAEVTKPNAQKSQPA